MHKISELLKPEVYARCFKHYKPEDFVNYGLGWIHIEERQKLIDMKAIVNRDGVDFIYCDTFVVKLKKKDEWETILEGTQRDCILEAEKIKNDKTGNKVKITSYPKAYIDFYKINEKRDYALGLEAEANDRLVDDEELLKLVTF